MLYTREQARAMSRVVERHGPAGALMSAHHLVGAIPSRGVVASAAVLLAHAGCLRQAESLLAEFSKLPGERDSFSLARMELNVCREQFDEAITLGVKLIRRPLSPEYMFRTLTLLVFSLRRSALAHRAVELLGDVHEGEFDRDLFTQMNHAAHECGRDELARHFGSRVLEHKLAGVETSLVSVVPASGRKVIALSLWGSEPLYLLNTVRNAGLVRAIWPGWSLRVYHDSTVPDFLLEILANNGVELRDMTGCPLPGSMFRFLVSDDPDVGVWICRDADALLLERDRRLVEEWLAGDRDFHVIRDHVMHVELMLAGLWGGRCRFTPSMAALLRDMETVRWDREQDQRFLAESIWPVIQDRAHISDAWYAENDPRAVATHPPDRQALHVGAAQHIPKGMTLDRLLGRLPLDLQSAQRTSLKALLR